MKSFVELSVQLLQDCGSMCGANPSLDIRTVKSRSKAEGDSFLTITLPSFGKAFDNALAEGRLSPSLFSGFSFQRRRCLPRFLGGFIERVFDSNGILLDEPDTDCIFCIRQICLMFKKVELPCTTRRERHAESQFVKCDREVLGHVADIQARDYFNRVSAVIWSDILRSVPFGDGYEMYVPRHGPGTTREGITGNRKFQFLTWPTRLESDFPFTEFGIGSISNFGNGMSDIQVRYLSPRDEQAVKVCFVPKTMKTPRVIAVEPVCMQYIQQAIADWIRPLIETRGTYTRRRVNFTLQSVNSNLARLGSINGRYATIDLSEASDRVSSSLVWNMLRVCPTFRRQVFACRSTRATLPNGNTIPIRKFASMGSALCFPIEAMVFFITVVSTRIRFAGVPVSPRTIRKYSRGVYVYGDDIIVPNDEAPSICDSLSTFGLVVNRAKTFWTGKFRESCGRDWYAGVDVTPVYVRRPVPADRTDAKGITSYVATANQLYKAGFWRCCRWIRSNIESILGRLPSVRSDSQGLGWHSYSEAMSFNGWDKDLQRLKLRALVPSPIVQNDRLSGDPALLKCFRLIGLKTVDPEHLLHSVRYGNLALKRRWIPA